MFGRQAPAAARARPAAAPAAAAEARLDGLHRPAAAAVAGGPPSAPVLEDDTAAEAAIALERNLVRRARAGDAAAFEQLVAAVMQPAYRLAVRLLGDRDLAEDVTQDALIKAYTAIGQFRGDSRFGTWVFRIVHNACTDALRYRARRPQLPLGAPLPGADEGAAPEREPADPRPGPEVEAIDRLGREAILAAVAALPAEYRAVVVLRDVQGFSYEEVAAITGQNLGTVKSRLHRARAALRAALGPAG